MDWIGKLYLWATRRLYNEMAWAYDLVSWLVSAGRWDRWRRLALTYVSQGPVLEVGFGTGELLIEMASHGLAPVGLDLSPAMQRVTARKMKRQGVVAPRVQGRVQALPFSDESFATIISTFPAEFIAHPATLQEFSRVLRTPSVVHGSPGGKLVVVGVWVQINNPLLRQVTRLLPGLETQSFMNRLEKSCAATGLAPSLVLHEDPPVRVPVIIAEKQS